MNETNVELLSLRGKAGLVRPVTPDGRRGTPAEPATDDEECGAFGYLRGLSDQARSIEFRFANGNREAFPYAWLGPAKYNPSAGLLLKFVGDQIYLVLIEGSNLNAPVTNVLSLYDRGILRHRITWVREMTNQELEEAREGDVTVEHIRTLSHRPDDEPKGVDWLEPFKERSKPSP